MENFLNKIIPAPFKLSELVKPIEVWIVQLRVPGAEENHILGVKVLPEVVACSSKEQAHDLCSFLNEASFFEFLEDIRTDEPDAAESVCRHLWQQSTWSHYIVLQVDDLSKYEHIEKLIDGEVAVKKLFANMKFVRKLRRTQIL